MEDLNNIKLTDKEMEKVYEVKKKGSSLSTDFLIDLYKYRYKLKMAPTDIAVKVGKSKRTIQYHLKTFGWEYDRFEAQKMAAKKRDYADIFRQNKNHQLKNAFSSKPEMYCRHLLNEILSQRVDGEVIVGINNRSILNGIEIDIPIVIIQNDKVHRYAVEFNTEFWHNRYNGESDNEKVEKIGKANYKYFEIWQFPSTKTQREYGTLEEQVDRIVEQILEDF